jgi:transmembrane sensor
MADLLAFRSRRRVDEDASLWLSRLDRGLGPDERVQLGQWLAADARHGRALVAMAALWDDMELLRELSGLLELPPRGRPSPPAGRWPWIALGAAVPLALLAVFLLRAPSSPAGGAVTAAASTSAAGAAGNAVSPRAPRAGEGAEYSTRLGEQRTEVLADGSIVKLNTATRIRVAFGAGERRVEVVAGEAHFEVQRDAARPFVVSAAGRRIRALGTAFNVRLARDGALRLTVTEGRVLVTRPGGDATPTAGSATPARAEVAAGEQLLAGGAAELPWKVEPLPPETLANDLAWQRGMLVFDGEPLEDALAEVARYGEVRFEIPDARLRRMRIGGVYKSGDIDGLVRSLERNFDLVVTRGPGGRIVVSEP